MNYIIGIDEVGRGCLAGDVYVAAFMAKETRKPIAGVDDSKKVNPVRRIIVAKTLQNDPETHFSVVSRSVHTIDNKGINTAIFECFYESALNLIKLGLPISSIKIDGKEPPNWKPLPIKTEFIIHGDANEWVIGAASILAKVTRDDYMITLDNKYQSKYLWSKNKGYGTKDHIEKIKQYGLSEHHRITFCKNFK